MNPWFCVAFDKELRLPASTEGTNSSDQDSIKSDLGWIKKHLPLRHKSQRMKNSLLYDSKFKIQVLDRASFQSA